jgi:hypothetical protein
LNATHRAILRQVAGVEPPWTVADAARVLCRPRDEVMDDLSVLIGHGPAGSTWPT